MKQRTQPATSTPAPTSIPRTATFESVFVAEYHSMVALAAAVSGSRIHAEDIAQEALSRLHRNWENVGSYDKPGAWLRRVTINLALSQKRRRATEFKALLRIGAPRAELPPALPEHQEIWALVAALPKMQRAVISLHFLEDQTTDEIAEVLEIAAPTVRVHLHRARKTLYAQLGPTASPNRSTDSKEARR